MQNYYQKFQNAYYEKTFALDPTSFLAPLAARLKQDATILDVGCGSGRDLLWFKERDFNVLGIERSEGLAKLARDHTGSHIIEAAFHAYDFSQLSVDAILLIGALVHITHDKMPAILKSVARALRMDGKILLTLKKGTGQSSDDHGRVFHLWQDKELRAVFKNFNLKVIDFFEQTSKTGSGELWLGYILEKTD